MYIEVAEVEEHGPARLPPAAKARLEADATARQQAYEEWGPPPQVLVYVGAGAATKVWVDRGDPPKAAIVGMVGAWLVRDRALDYGRVVTCGCLVARRSAPAR
jgi:hypothetical protein